jgi:hypothetical protein
VVLLQVRGWTDRTNPKVLENGGESWKDEPAASVGDDGGIAGHEKGQGFGKEGSKVGHEGLEEKAGKFVVRDKDGDGDTAMATGADIGWIEDGVIATAKLIDFCEVFQADMEQGCAGLDLSGLQLDERLFRWLGCHGGFSCWESSMEDGVLSSLLWIYFR